MDIPTNHNWWYMDDMKAKYMHDKLERVTPGIVMVQELLHDFLSRTVDESMQRFFWRY